MSSKHKWTATEDAALVACMVDMHNIGHRNADSGFKGTFLPELEKMLTEKLPGCGLKAKPHIESRLKTLKKDWSIVYDMVHGKNTSGFGWDDTRKMVTAEDEVWNAYIQSHKEAAPFRMRTFVHFDDMNRIYAKDRATGRDSQTVQEVLQEAENEDTPYPSDHVESSSTNTSAGKKRKKRTDDTLEKVVSELGKSFIGCMTAPVTVRVVDGIQEKIQEQLHQLDGALSSLDGITFEEKGKAHVMFSKNRDLVPVFFGIEPMDRLRWIRFMLSSMTW